MTPKIKLIIANPAIYPPANKGSEPRHLINTSCLSWRTSFRVDAAILAQEQGFPPGPWHRQAPRTASLKPKGIACYQVSRCLSYILHTPPHSHAHASQASDSIKWTVYNIYDIYYVYIYIFKRKQEIIILVEMATNETSFLATNTSKSLHCFLLNLKTFNPGIHLQ